MSKILSSCIALATVVALAGAVSGQARVIKKKVADPKNSDVIVIEVDRKTGEVRTRPVDPKGGKVLHVIGDLALQKSGNKKVSDDFRFDSKDGKKVIIKKIQGDKAHNVEVKDLWIQDGKAKAGTGAHGVWIQDGKAKVKAIDGAHGVWIQRADGKKGSGNVWIESDKVKKSGDNVWIEKSEDGKVIRKKIQIQKKHQEHGSHDHDGHHHHGDHDEDVRIEKTQDGKRIMIRRKVDGKVETPHGVHGIFVPSKTAKEGQIIRWIQKDDEKAKSGDKPHNHRIPRR